jgi:uncharacterized protein (TIGR03086 family)
LAVEAIDMTSQNESVILLSRALDQAGDVLVAVHEDHLSKPTPCRDWDVSQLVAHLVADPGNLLAMARGDDVDWSAQPDAPPPSWAQVFRSAADDLMHHWHQQGDDADAGQVDWQTAEFAVHTWDLARAIRWPRPLDPEVAERGYAFMSQALTPENRGQAFSEEQTPPADAGPYERLAAFAGRNV